MDCSPINNMVMSKRKLVTNWKEIESVPEKYVVPPEKRPGVVVEKTIPVFDLATPDRGLLCQKILDIAQEFGIFQVINHGISKELVEETMKVFKEFHGMSPEEKTRECYKYSDQYSTIYTSSLNYDTEKIHRWKDSLVMKCHPLDKCVHFWPENPPQFREVVKAYSVAMKKLVVEILEIISEGLGLGKKYLRSEMIDNQALAIHHYPPCPNPSLTLGNSPHGDPTLITILFQDIKGLQFLKDGQWIAVDPIDNAFVVNIGFIFEVISNGKVKAPDHRVVTNMKKSRQTLACLVYPEDNVIIEPAKSFINEANPQHYRSFNINDFTKKYLSMAKERETVIKYISC